MITVPNSATLEYDLGAYALTSAPIVVGIETSLKENKNIVGVPLYGKHDYGDTIEIDFEIGKTWYYKFYIEDINNSDVYRQLPYREDNGNWLYEKLMFVKPNESQSGFYEMTYEYELREDGCFHVTLNSYTGLWQDQGGLQRAHNKGHDVLLPCGRADGPAGARRRLPHQDHDTGGDRVQAAACDAGGHARHVALQWRRGRRADGRLSRAEGARGVAEGRPVVGRDA